MSSARENTTLLLFFVAIPCSSATAGTRSSAVVPNQLPAGIQVQGKALTASQWKDSTGDNLVVLSATGEHPSPAQTPDGDAETDSEIYATAFRRRGETWERAWTLWDHVEQCRFDTVCQFVKPSLEITDLDGNGVAEVSFVYRLACVSGMDRWDQKLFLVEGGRKYAARGWIDGSVDDEGVFNCFGDMKLDLAFNTAPSSFKAFATQKWNRFLDQRQPCY